MADGGASSMIMLVTALFISATASSVLISAWSDSIRVVQTNGRSEMVADQIDAEIVGDLAMVAYDTTTDTMTIYVSNTGEYTLSTTEFEAYVDGTVVSTTSTSVLPSGTDWDPGTLLEVDLTNTAWTYTDGTDVSINFIGISEMIQGRTHGFTLNAEVRLNVV